MYTGVWPSFKSVLDMQTVPKGIEEGTGPSGNRVKDCQPQCGCWESNPRNLGKQPVLITARTSLWHTVLAGPKRSLVAPKSILVVPQSKCLTKDHKKEVKKKVIDPLSKIDKM